MTLEERRRLVASAVCSRLVYELSVEPVAAGVVHESLEGVFKIGIRERDVMAVWRSTDEHELLCLTAVVAVDDVVMVVVGHMEPAEEKPITAVTIMSNEEARMIGAVASRSKK